MPKIAIYSCITNSYDTPKPVTIPGVDHILFTDDKDINAPGWKIVEIPESDDCREQRKIKILGHKALDKYDVTIYIDGNVTLKRQFQTLLKQYKGGLMTGQHPKRNCIYSEGLTIKELKKAPADEVDAHVFKHYKEGLPANNGLWWNNVLIRDKSCKEFNEVWYEDFVNGCHRDQISFAYAKWILDYNIHTFRTMNYISKSEHKTQEPIKVYYSSPFRSDKNIGLANNEFIELLPDDAWVCITDADISFLNPDYGTRIESIIKDFGGKYDLIGCLTNRIGSLHQCYGGKFSEDMDMYNHYEIANNKELPHEVIEGGVAGFVMIFSKKTWKKVGGFEENTPKADTLFNKAIKKSGGKCGVYQGLYVFHAYRIWEKEHKKARFSVKHLEA